ncbi:MAG: glycosyltransferase [Chloroflexota bacterium]
MATSPLTFHLMTAALSPGDAIGNYMLTMAGLLRGWGARVELYADFVAPEYGALARPSVFYRPGGLAVLWYHYSIYADNLEIAAGSQDYKIMDFHGVTPPHLFAGQDSHLQMLCQQALARLPLLRDSFDRCVVHSEYTRQELINLGYDSARIHKLPLVWDSRRYDGPPERELEEWLGRLRYLLFVGRLVPQKDILALLDIFAEAQARRPDVALIVVGGRHLAPRYQRQIDQAIGRRGLAGRLLLTGQVNNPAILSALYRQARLLLVTSEWESFCVPLVEAMHFGVPAVVHDLPPLPEVAGAAGLVVDKRKPAEAAGQMVALLDDPARYEALRRAAGERAAAFTEVALGRALLAMLGQVGVSI